ncbi:MAG: transcription elongation factor GreA [Coriobacteriales bacterium]|jgi:transcription elongation factor GreA|nr:transcription elongation factor GreA [Coriobacteriales bacterium]
MTGKTMKLTKEGRSALEQELQHLETERRAEVGERLRVALEFGDISENSEYDDAKNEQAWVESRIAEINQILANAEIIEVPKRSNKINIGNTVTVRAADGSEKVFTIVGAAEADASQGRISNESPVGAALIGKHRDDTVVAEGPTGRKLEFTILKISR